MIILISISYFCILFDVFYLRIYVFTKKIIIIISYLSVSFIYNVTIWNFPSKYYRLGTSRKNITTKKEYIYTYI